MSSISTVCPSYQDGYSTPPGSPRQSQPKVTPDRRKLLTHPLTSETTSPYAEAEWYANTQTQLQRLKELDKQIRPLEQEINDSHITDAKFDHCCSMLQSLDSEYKTVLEAFHYNIQDIEQPKDLLIVLKLLATFTFQDTEKLFYSVLTTLRRSLRELDNYMVDIPTMEHEGPVLTPQGVSKIIEFFHKEYNIPEKMLSCCSNTSLKFRLKEMLDRKVEREAIGWVVHQDDFQANRHLVPVFAVFYQGILHIHIIDSQGHDIHPDFPEYTRLSHCLESLRDFFSKMRGDELENKVQLYSYQSRRQSGNVECSVFSLLDLKCLIEMYRAGENLVDYFWQQVSETSRPKKITPEMLGKRSGFPFYELQILPPSLMKPTQSISVLRDLEEKYLDAWNSYNAFRLNSLGETITETQDVNMLYKKVEQCKVLSDEGIVRNAYARNKRLSYIIYLILTILEGPGAQLEELC